MAKAAPRDDVARRAAARRRAEAMGGRDPRGAGLGACPQRPARASARPPARCCGSTSRTASTARGARGRSRTDPSRLEFCENGAKAVAEEATDRRITADFFAAHSIDELADRSDYWLGQQGRLTEPVYRAAGDDHYRPIAWDAAFALVADRLRSLASPDRAVFYTSGRTSNEAAFLYQLFVRAFGTNNLPDCSNMCHESSGVALGETIGIGKGTVTLDDVHAAELILVVGQNPGTNHPRMLSALEQAKRNGAAIVVDQPAAGGRADRIPQPAAPPRRRRPGHRARRPAPADRRRRRPRPVPVGQPAARRRAWRRRPSSSSTATATGSPSSSLTSSALDADALLAATGLDPAAAEALVERVASRDADHRLLGDGTHPAPPGRGDDPGDRQHAAVARLDRAPRRRAVPGARAQQRAGRPHDGHRRAPAGCVARRAGRPVRVRPAAPPRLRHRRRRSRRWPPDDVDVFVGLGGNFVAAAPDTDVTAAAMRALRTDRAGVDEAQPLARPVRRARR